MIEVCTANLKVACIELWFQKFDLCNKAQSMCVILQNICISSCAPILLPCSAILCLAPKPCHLLIITVLDIHTSWTSFFDKSKHTQWWLLGLRILNLGRLPGWCCRSDLCWTASLGALSFQNPAQKTPPVLQATTTAYTSWLSLRCKMCRHVDTVQASRPRNEDLVYAEQASRPRKWISWLRTSSSARLPKLTSPI